MEVWKDIKNYEGIYQVSSLGRVKSLPRKWIIKERILTPYTSDNYHTVCLSVNQNRKRHYIHKLVAIAFLNHIQSGHDIVVDHINEIKEDNRLINLQLLTTRENTIKYYKYKNKMKNKKKFVKFWDYNINPITLWRCEPTQQIHVYKDAKLNKQKTR